ncbi:MAG TPA: ATP-binding protein, partial [Albitalea sp.]
TGNIESAGNDDLPAGPYVEIAVTDTGTGIAKDTLAKVFDPFFTTKEPGKGSGLGLSMVYGFVKQSGGQVRVYSEVGVGTTVKLLLPRSAAPASDVPAPAMTSSALPRARDGETVLVVEDDDGVRRHCVSALEGFGYRVLAAPDGAAALRLLEDHPHEPIALLFTDVVLPGGMTGRSLADAARTRRGGLPVLYASGYTRSAIVHDGRLDPDVRLLSKPYTLESLARGVRQAIDGG